MVHSLRDTLWGLPWLSPPSKPELTRWWLKLDHPVQCEGQDPWAWLGLGALMLVSFVTWDQLLIWVSVRYCWAYSSKHFGISTWPNLLHCRVGEYPEQVPSLNGASGFCRLRDERWVIYLPCWWWAFKWIHHNNGTNNSNNYHLLIIYCINAPLWISICIYIFQLC